MDEPLTTIRTFVQETLDDIVSLRSSLTTRTFALKRLENQLADYVQDEDTARLDLFIALQHTFECNVPSRLIPWIAEATRGLDEPSSIQGDGSSETIYKLSGQVTVALSLLQGIVMLHSSSKEFLGRKYCLEIIIELLLASRHVPAPPVPNPSAPSPSKSMQVIIPLTSAVLDALLCILVDSPAALRVFEDCNGVQAIVKILKRAGTPREVRMKCLEFLYFYLLDETPSFATSQEQSVEALISPMAAPTHVPPTPKKMGTKKPYLNGTPHHPTSRQGSSGFSSMSASSTLYDGSSRSASSSSTSSASSVSTGLSSVESSPKKEAGLHLSWSPPRSPPSSRPVPKQFQPRSLHLLQKDVDFVPQSPQKFGPGRVGTSSFRHISGRSMSRTPSNLGSAFSYEPKPKVQQKKKTRTIEEKKEILGTMLGNVDALVEGVRKAGIWGLAN